MDTRAVEVLSSLTDPEIDAMVEVMLLAACADGTIDYAEVAVLKRSLRAVDEHWLSHVDLDERIESAKRRVEAETREARLAKLRTMLPWPEQRLLALQLATRIVTSDGVVQEKERELILEAADALGVRSELAAKVMGQLG
jgi:uncharacterized tellurite resistance protein B-like protein